MHQKIWIQCLAALCFVFGGAKVMWPSFFIDIRKNNPWIDLFDFYSFIFKATYAERAVRINGGALLVISAGLAAWATLN